MLHVLRMMPSVAEEFSNWLITPHWHARAKIPKANRGMLWPAQTKSAKTIAITRLSSDRALAAAADGDDGDDDGAGIQ